MDGRRADGAAEVRLEGLNIQCGWRLAPPAAARVSCGCPAAVLRVIWAPGAGIATLEGVIDIVRGCTHRAARRAVLALCVLLGVMALAVAVLWPVSPPAGEVADRILASSHITLVDGARTDIEDTAAGVPARAATYTFRVSETTGGAFDVDLIGGRPLDASGGVQTHFMEGCRANGATEVWHEVDHVHCGWRKPRS
jgi:hypothetical protein